MFVAAPIEHTYLLQMNIRYASDLGALFSIAIVSLSACNVPAAMGEASSLIVIVPDTLWRQVEEPTRTILEPTIFTTRNEKQYEVTSVDPTHPKINELRLFRNVVVFGTAQDPTIAKVAESGGINLSDFQPGRVFQVRDVWARGQTVTAALLRGGGQEVTSWVAALPSVLNAIDESYRAYVLRKMYATPPDTALAQDLHRRFAFSLQVPQVYDRVVRGTDQGDSLVIVRNDNPDPSQLIRSVLVTWRPKVDSLTQGGAFEWRSEIDGTQYNVAQRINDTHSNAIYFKWEGRDALEVTGIWEDERGNFPAAGPFIVWLVDCPTRTYMIDAWLYAPNEPKYEYMLQLQEILSSFRCVSMSE